MRRLISAALTTAALAATAPGALAENDGKVTYSYYLISCGSYVQHRERGTPSDANNTADTFYVAGWLSAYNRLKSGSAVPEDATLDDVMLWLDGYCADNPLSNLENGLFALSEEVKPGKAATPTTQAPPPTSTLRPSAAPAPAAPHAPVQGLRPLPY